MMHVRLSCQLEICCVLHGFYDVLVVEYPGVIL